jgi:hypothetical protein
MDPLMSTFTEIAEKERERERKHKLYYGQDEPLHPCMVVE